MPVCNFFLQGRCRYGDKCWNDHPAGGGGGGGGERGGGGYNNNNNSYSSPAQQQPRGGGGGFGNRVWVNPSQQKVGYVQPSSFSSHGTEEWGQGGSGGADWSRAGDGGGGNDWSKGGGGGGGGNNWGRGGSSQNDWGRGGGAGGRRDNVSFAAPNRFSTLGSPTTFENRGGGQQVPVGEEDDDKKLETIQMDMDIWENSGQWGFSCYSSFKAPLSGFADVSPEELRLEYLTRSASGEVSIYVNAIHELINRWRSRVQELKVMNPATRAALLAEINNPAPQASSSGFGSATVLGSATDSMESKGFGAPAPAASSTFSFAAPSGGFGSLAAPGFGSASAAPTQAPSGFGSSTAASSAPNASSFSFAAPSTNKPAATSGFGSASGFNFTSTQNATGGGFGSGFGAAAPASVGGDGIFQQTSGGFGKTAAPPAAGVGSAGAAPNSLFSHESNMSPEELAQFKAKRFTLGQIPLKPPPVDMLVV